MWNIFKTAMLLAVLTVMLVLIGSAFGGRQGMQMAFVLALLMNLGSYWFSVKIVLAMYGARPIDEAQAPGLYAIVRRLTTRAGLPMPRVYLIPTDTPNAFATGRNPHHAAVAVTEGIMRILNDEELEGVLAHELAHVKNRDVLISTIAATLAGAITYLAHMAQWAAMFGGRSSDDEERGGNPLGLILMAVLAPVAAMLVQLAVSRAREFQADATGARVAGRPRGLAQALEKLERANEVAPMAANPSTAHLFIVNPLGRNVLMRLFSTHPPIEERIARLRAMRALAPLATASSPHDDRLDRDLIRKWLAWGFVWLLVFPTLRALISAKFNDPDFLADVAWLSLGRLRPLHVNGVIWGAFSTLFIGLCHYIVPRLCGVRLAGAMWSRALLLIWNLNLLLAVVLMALGWKRGWEAGDLPLGHGLGLFLVLIAFTAQCLGTIGRRRAAPLYVSLWDLRAALVWTDEIGRAHV